MSEQAFQHGPEPAGAEGRIAPRVRSFLRGECVSMNGAIRSECTVRDLSETGARIQISGGITLPEHFDLFIPQRNRREKAKLVWRHAEEAGLIFVNRQPVPQPETGAATPSTAMHPGEIDHRVHTLEAEIAQLRSQLAIMRAMVEQVFKDRA